ISDRHQSQRTERTGCKLTAHCDRLIMGASLFHDQPERAQYGSRDRVEPISDPRIPPVGRVKKLDEVGCPDREKVGPLEQLIELVQQRGALNHRTDLNARGQLMAMAPQMSELTFYERPRFIKLLNGRDHRKHEIEITATGCP